MFLSYAFKELRRRKTRTALAVFGIGCSVALLIAVFAISHSVQSAVRESLAAAGADLVIQKRVKPCPFAEVKFPKDLGAIDESVVARLEEQEGVVEVSGVLELWAFYQGHPTVVTGMDPLKRSIGPVRRAPQPIEGEDEEEAESCCALSDGRYLLTRDEYACLLTDEYAAALGVKVGDKVNLGPQEFEVVGTLELGPTPQIAGAEAFIPLKVAQRMLGQGAVVDTIFVEVEHGRYVKQVEQSARELIPIQNPEEERVSVTTSGNVDAGTAALANVAQSSLMALSLIVLGLVWLLVIKSSLSSVAERVPEIGIMKAVGWRNSHVSRLLSLENAIVSLAAGVVGCVAGWAIAVAYAAFWPQTLPSALASYPPCATTQAPTSLPLHIAPTTWIFALGLGAALLMGVVSGSLASRRAARLRPAEALRQI